MTDGRPLRRSFDPNSARVLRRFAIMLVFISAWAMVAVPQAPMRAMSVMMMFAAVTDCLLALLRRERPMASELNCWDGAAGFLAVACLLHGIA
jgi:hypothetical protein